MTRERVPWRDTSHTKRPFPDVRFSPNMADPEPMASSLGLWSLCEDIRWFDAALAMKYLPTLDHVGSKQPTLDREILERM